MELRLVLDETAWPVGLNVRVAVPSGPSTSQLVVPRDALVLRREGNVVFRINGENKAERVPVNLGVASGEMIAVEGELNAGDKIVIRGSERLQPGQTVAIKNNNDTLVSMQGN
jgi:multidrug efflux pump subunit AcrA (membrane-fusion protein)